MTYNITTALFNLIIEILNSFPDDEEACKLISALRNAKVSVPASLYKRIMAFLHRHRANYKASKLIDELRAHEYSMQPADENADEDDEEVENENDPSNDPSP